MSKTCDVTYSVTIGLSFSFLFASVPGSAWSRMRTLYLCFSFCLVWLQRLLFVLRSDDGWFRHWKPIWVPFGDSFQKAFLEEWEQEAHASVYSGQVSEYRWKTQDLSDKEIFARLTHESSDESESICGPYWTPKPVNSSGIFFDTLKRMGDGWGFSREPPPVPPGLPSTRQPSWQPYPDANASRSSWAFRNYDKQLSARPAGRGLFNHWTCLHRRNKCLHRWNEPYLRLHIPSNMGLYPYDFPCRTQTTNSSPVMTKASRPYEMSILRGEYLILNTGTSLGAGSAKSLESGHRSYGQCAFLFGICRVSERCSSTLTLLREFE